jgi:hypothetical protein
MTGCTDPSEVEVYIKEKYTQHGVKVMASGERGLSIALTSVGGTDLSSITNDLQKFGGVLRSTNKHGQYTIHLADPRYNVKQARKKETNCMLVLGICILMVLGGIVYVMMTLRAHPDLVPPHDEE